MKRLRFWLVVVLAAMLPLRGAMAAAMVCAPVAAVEVRMSHTGHDHHAAQGDEEFADPAMHDHGDRDAAHEKCTMCSSFCSATPLPSTLPDVPASPPIGTARYPTLDAPVPMFQSDGQERPPRSI